ncbi:MAG: hypothetical protein GY744_15205 [Gammaproteobacteria bacterium]|nr:hypothetical protein [Gammaproteobacteria bacterium]
MKVIRKGLAKPAPQKTTELSNEQTIYPCPECKKGSLILKHGIAPLQTWGYPLPD